MSETTIAGGRVRRSARCGSAGRAGKRQGARRAEVDEHVRHPHRDCPMGEVDDAAAAVLEHQPEPKDRINGAGAKAEEKEEDLAGHTVG